jgi:MtN3 and saliva related transmembrane protein
LHTDTLWYLTLVNIYNTAKFYLTNSFKIYNICGDSVDFDITIIGYIAGTLTTFASLPQLIKSLKEKDMSNISLAFVVTFTTGLMLWLVYGILRNDYPIIVFNILSLMFWIPITYLKIKDEMKIKTTK